MTGHVITSPVDATPAPCYPSTHRPACDSCSRFCRRLDAPRRMVVVIDASIARGDPCPMWLPFEDRSAA